MTNIINRFFLPHYFCDNQILSTMHNHPSKISAIVKMKCPTCHEGDLFKDPNPYSFSNWDKMYDECPVCKQSYTPEPGFFYGAMYVSYAITVALFVTTWVAILVLGIDMPLWGIMVAVGVVFVSFMPLTFRFSRSIWFHFFYGYKSKEERLAQKN